MKLVYILPSLLKAERVAVVVHVTDLKYEMNFTISICHQNCNWA